MNAIKAFEDGIEEQILELRNERIEILNKLVTIDRTIARLETMYDLNELHRSNPKQENQGVDSKE